jgi:hypothetical protein
VAQNGVPWGGDLLRRPVNFEYRHNHGQVDDAHQTTNCVQTLYREGTHDSALLIERALKIASALEQHTRREQLECCLKTHSMS